MMSNNIIINKKITITIVQNIQAFGQNTSIVQLFLLTNLQISPLHRSLETKDGEAEKKLNDHITSYTKLINDLSREDLSTKGLAQDLINTVFKMVQNILMKKDHNII